MLRKKLFIFLTTLTLALTVFTGCGNASKQDIPTTESVQDTQEQEKNTFTVKVTSVKDGTVTAQVGKLSETAEMPSGDNGDGNAPEGNPPEKPSGDNADGSAPEGNPPEMPSGDNGDGNAPEGNPPEMSSGDNADGSAPEGNPPEMPGGEMPQMGGTEFKAQDEEITFQIDDDTKITVEYLQGSEEGTIDDIVENAVLEVSLDDDNHATAITVKNLNKGNGFGGSTEVTNGTSANTITEDGNLDNQTYTSTGDDENAVRVDGAVVNFQNLSVNKEGGESSNTEDGDFYGQNAGLLALNGATVTISNATVTTNAVNGNGVFSYGEGTTVNISDSTIQTSQNNSGGIQTTGGGTTNATNLTVETKGNSAAAIRSDRGGGTVNVTGGTYTTNGTGSPAVYCTADIHVSDAVLTANASEGIVVEGKNSVELNNCTLIGSMSGTYNGDSSENIHGVMIYQSMSGDAAVGKAQFIATGGTIETTVGDLFYVTNIACEITLENVELKTANDVVLRVAGNESSRGWGTSGANGGDVVLTTKNQKMNGDILVDDISTLSYTMSAGTEFTGTINEKEETGEVDVIMESGAKWNLTGDSYVSSFDGDLSQITTNGYHLYVNGSKVN